MALNNIEFNIADGQLARPLAGQDHISGLLFFNDTLPTGFGASDRIKVVYNVREAEAVGITAALFPLFHYHISEFFRLSPGATLYVGIYEEPTHPHAYGEIQTMQQFSLGNIRQIGVLADWQALNTADVTAIQAVCETLLGNHMPLVAIFAPEISGTSDLSTLPDLRGLDAENVAVLIGEDGIGAGGSLAGILGNSVTCLGATLGAVSASSVHENIGWVGKFQMNNGQGELFLPAFANGDYVRDIAASVQDAINDKGYVFLRQFVGLLGAYHNDSHTATATTSDFRYIENVRTMNKAIRNLRTYLLPDLNSPLTLNADGTLTSDTLGYFEGKCRQALDEMARNGEVSDFGVTINSSQNVLSTSTLTIEVSIVPVGTARNIEFNIGFALSIS